MLLIFVSWAGVAVWVTLIILNQKKYHPRALFILFFAEMWERFSFYGMRALLILYMTKDLFTKMEQGSADIRAYGIYGAYTALLYASPVIGGLVSDRILGFRYAILTGGILMSFGQFTLAATIGNQFFFFTGLALLAVGNGFFKPNISSFLGTFYEPNDKRKDSAFTIFYMGINVGAFLAPITCGYLGQHINWSLGFLTAGIGMILGTIVFWFNMRAYEDRGNPPEPEKLNRPAWAGISTVGWIIAGTILMIIVFGFLMDAEKITNYILTGVGLACLGYLTFYALKLEDKVAGKRLIVFVLLFFFHMVFWTLYEQAGGSLNILTDRYVNKHGLVASQFQAVPALFIVLMAPVFAFIWMKLRKLKIEPYTPLKFFWGLIMLSIGYMIIIFGTRSVIGTEKLIPVVFLIFMYFFHTVGELCISPVGLSVVTKLSPAKTVGFVMGSWFLSIALAEKIAGFLGQLIATPQAEIDKSSALNSFSHVYLVWGVFIVLGSAFILLILSPLLRKWMHGIH